jgi:uncharacterized membrane protein YgcG
VTTRRSNAVFLDILDDYPEDKTGWSLRVLSDRDFATVIAWPQRFVELGFTKERNGEGGGSVTLDLGDPILLRSSLPGSEKRALVQQEAVWEFWLHGRYRFAMLAEDTRETPLPDENGLRTVEFTGRGLACVLEWWKIWPDGMPDNPKTGKRKFTGQTRMGAWLAMLAEAKAHHTLTFVHCTFTAEADSAGHDWTDDGDFQWDAGVDLLSQLKNICTTHGYTFEMGKGCVLSIWHTRGQHLEDQVQLTLWSNQEKSERTRSRREIATHCRIWNGDKLVAGNSDGSAADEWHTRWAWVRTASALDMKELNTIADQEIALYKDEELERTVKVSPDDPGRAIFIDYDVLDWVTVELQEATADKAARKVIAATIKLDVDGNYDLELTLNQRRQSLAEKLNNLINRSKYSNVSDPGGGGGVGDPGGGGGGGGGGDGGGDGGGTLTGDFAVVFHGDDGTVARPDGPLVVYWIGAAIPENGLVYDFWYTATVAA